MSNIAASNATQERLYSLLPAFYRTLDQQQGEPLRALLAVMETELRRLEGDIEHLYENWFIETCDEWLIPYLGELVGIQGLLSVDPQLFSMRSFVANALQYRRRKGTPGALETVAHDVTGWPILLTESFQLLVVAQNLNHTRLQSHRTPDLRKLPLSASLQNPFNTTTRMVELRRPMAGRGKSGLSTVCLNVWRLRANQVKEQEAVPAVEEDVPSPSDGYYRFSILGQDIPLFNVPQPKNDPSVATAAIHLPVPLERSLMLLNAATVPNSLIPPETNGSFTGPDKALSIQYRIPGETRLIELTASDIFICDLQTWRRPPVPNDSAVMVQPGLNGGGSLILPRIGVDPISGRLALTTLSHTTAPNETFVLPEKVLVSYAYGSVGDIGGGFYSRHKTLSAIGDRQHLKVPDDYDSISAALAAWSAGQYVDAVIELTDSGEYNLPSTISLPADTRLELRAANRQRPLLRISSGGITPLCTITMGKSADLVLDGVWITGGGLLIHRLNDDDGQAFTVRHCTLVPGYRLNADGTPAFEPQLNVQDNSVSPVYSLQVDNSGECSVSLIRSISGSILLPETVGHLKAEDVIVDALPHNVSAPPDAGLIPTPMAIQVGVAELHQVTVFGSVKTEVLTLASNCIFTDVVTVTWRQQGGIRFCYAREGSTLPTRYRCQPEVNGLSESDTTFYLERVRPRFASTQFGQHNYAQLSRNCAPELSRGADDEGEMGVYHFLQERQRESNLMASLSEFLNVGMEAGVFFIT